MRHPPASSLLGRVAAFALAAALAAALPAAPAAAAAAAMRFTPYTITDPSYGGMRMATLSLPAGWQVQQRVQWDYTSANYPVRVHLRAQSPDGRMWIELLPMDAVYWMDRFTQGLRPGQRSFGAVYAPNATIDQAMEHLVVMPWRGQLPGLRIVSRRPVDAARMAQAFGYPALRGEAMAMRVRYSVDGAAAEEDFYGFYTATHTIPYQGPQGLSHEYHRMLVLAHAVGATDGLLDSVYPLLGTVAASVRPDPDYQRHVQEVSRYITEQFNAYLQRGYDSIRAAGQLSRTISANNDALLASMQQQRAAQQRADAARRQAAGGGRDAADAFSQYIRGTTRMTDPYWGTSERDSNYSHHWTDGQGNYRASNDATYNPNVGAGGGPTWQRMEPAR